MQRQPTHWTDPTLGLREETTDSDCSCGGTSLDSDHINSNTINTLQLQPTMTCPFQQTLFLPQTEQPNSSDNDTLDSTLIPAASSTTRDSREATLMNISAGSTAAAGAAGEPTDYQQYQLFPRLHNQQPCLPTFADVFGQPVHSYPFYQDDLPPARAEAGIHSDADGHFSNIPATMLADPFGMAGLLGMMRSARSDSRVSQLAIGEDLTTFGLDLAAQGDIYVHFNGPFTQQPPERSSSECALELGMRGLRDGIERNPARPPSWEPFVAETRDLGLIESQSQLSSYISSRTLPSSANFATDELFKFP